MRIDAHQHFWHYDPREFGWISDAMPVLQRDYMPPDLKPLLERNTIQGSVAVQARQSEEETTFLLELAERYDFVRGVVGWVDLRSPQVGAQLQKYSAHKKLRGIRHLVQDEADDRFMLLPDFSRGLSLLADFNLTYDLLLHPRHLPVAVEVVKQFPRQRFVVDHIAKPFIKDGIVTPWADGMRALARFDNVYCKVSGMVTEAAWQKWKRDDFKPYLDVVFDCFGVDRLMFGSDWPVCTLSASYDEVVGIVQDYIRDFPNDKQEKFFGMNAADFYGLE